VQTPGTGKHPLRVYRVIARLNVGGPAMHVVNLARDLDASGEFTTTLVAGRIGDDEGDMGYYAGERGVSPVWIESLGRAPSLSNDLRTLLQLVRLFRRDRPDIVHTHTAKAGTLGRIAARIAGVPIVVHTFHGHVLGGSYFSPLLTGVYRFIERQVARLTDCIVALTPGQAAELTELGVAEEARFRVIPLGLELERFRATSVEMGAARRSAIRAEFGTGPETPVVGIVGRLVPVKNHELLFRALVELSAPELWIVGAGEREAELRALARELGVADRIRWLGWRHDLTPLYPAMEVVALVSHDEGTPVALLESLAAGTPVVATEVGGVGEVMRGLGLGASLVPAGDVRALAQSLARVLYRVPVSGGDSTPAGSPPRVAVSVQDQVVSGWAPERLADEVAALYRELAHRKGLAQR